MTEQPSFEIQLAEASLDELERLWREALRTFMANIGVPELAAQAAEAVACHPEWKALEADWITLPSRIRRDRYAHLLELVEEAGYATRPYCTRCGACCRGSGPSLFADDLRLFEEGILTRSDVLTLRNGERVQLPLDAGTTLLKKDLVKVRENESGHCRFFEESSASCSIYADRPLQCRAQACWDTSDLRQALKKEPPLTRIDLVRPDEPIAPALVAHESHCDLVGIAEALEDAVGGRADGMDVVIDALAYDHELRPLMRDRLPVPAEELEFYFGRPLYRVVEQFGVRVVGEPDGTFRLEAMAPAGPTGG